MAFAAMAPVNPATNDVQPVRKPASRPYARVQVDIFAARARAHRRQFGVGHGAGKGERAPGEPGPDEPDRVGDAGGNDRGGRVFPRR